jgi:LDH2 family malate/lactate/ureidoglycolate dehydrogenase
VRPAWARSWRCKSSAELATARQVKRNCVRATERGEEAWSVNREPRYTNRIRGGAGQGEQAIDCEALVAKGQAT